MQTGRDNGLLPPSDRGRVSSELTVTLKDTKRDTTIKGVHAQLQG